MAVKINITGSNHADPQEKQAHVHAFETTHGLHSGLLVLSDDLRSFTPNIIPFLNDSFGNAMNQAVTFGGTPELIHDGTAVGVWVPTANQGTWDFTGGGKVTITAALNNDNAIFDDAGTIDMSNYVGISGKIDLDTYNPLQNSITIQFSFGGGLVGNSVDLNDYIDVGDFEEQSFAIPKGDLGLGAVTVDAMIISIVRTGGTKPTVKFDDIQIEETGSAITFKVSASRGKSDFHVKKLRFQFADNITGIITGSTTTYPTMSGISYDKILGLTRLTNGILVQIVVDGKVIIAASLKQLSDMMGIGADIVNIISDGVNTFLTLELTFSEPLLLKRGRDTADFISITVNDDLSGLLLFTGAARGAYES